MVHVARGRAFIADLGGWGAHIVACTGGVFFLSYAVDGDVCRNAYARTRMILLEVSGCDLFPRRRPIGMGAVVHGGSR